MRLLPTPTTISCLRIAKRNIHNRNLAAERSLADTLARNRSKKDENKHPFAKIREWEVSAAAVEDWKD